MSKKINYSSRDFNAVRSELLNFIKQYYPDLFSDFNDASVGMMLLELNAAVADQLAFNTDRMFQETQLEYAQERRNVLAHAKTLGLHIPHKKPSITIVDFSIEVPPFGDTYDSTYLPIIKTGAQIMGAGKMFETIDDVDFSNGYSGKGVPNRIILPTINSNNQIRSYKITKREIVTNGTTKIFKKIVTASEYKPFLEVILPDEDVISVEQVLNLEGANYDTNPTVQQFLGNKNKFYEVDALAEDKLFIEDIGKLIDRSGVKAGRYLSISKKFVKEYTESGFCKLIFGGGMPNANVFEEFMKSLNMEIPFVSNFLNNDALGEIPKANSTLFIRYRVGGGAASNVGANVLTGMGNIDMTVNGVNESFNIAVKSSLKVNNPIPALGGNDEPSVEQIRRLISYNFSAQNRCVTTRDYLTQIHKMDGKFGAPFRVSAHELENKIVLSILALNEKGKLENQSTTTLKENIAIYLSKYRMINDYVEITDGKIINLSFEVDLLVDKSYSQSEVISGVISTIDKYLDINDHDMNENIYMAQLIENINNVSGVLNIIEIRVFNKIGGDYGNNQISQKFLNDKTKQIKLVDYTIFGEESCMFQCFNPKKDIIIRTKSN